MAEKPAKSAEGGKKRRQNPVDSRVKGPKIGGPIGVDESPLEGKEAGKELAKIGGNIASENGVEREGKNWGKREKKEYWRERWRQVGRSGEARSGGKNRCSRCGVRR